MIKGQTRKKGKEGDDRQQAAVLWIGLQDQGCERVVVQCNVSTSPVLSPSIHARPRGPPHLPPTPLQQLFNMEIDLSRSRDIRSGTRGQVPPVSRGEANER